MNYCSERGCGLAKSDRSVVRRKCDLRRVKTQGWDRQAGFIDWGHLASVPAWSDGQYLSEIFLNRKVTDRR